MKNEKKTPEISNDCTICRIFHDFDNLFAAYPAIPVNEPAENTMSLNYSALRAEMLEGFTRVANARNWVILSLFAVLSVIFSDQPKIDHKFLLLGGSSIIIGLLSHFAAVAYKDIWDLGALLLAFEVKHEKHFSNEHHSWLNFMGIPKNYSLPLLIRRYSIDLETVRNFIASNNLSTMGNIEIITNPNRQPFRKPFITFITDFYLWLSCLNLMNTVYLFCNLCSAQQTELCVLFAVSIIPQAICVLFAAYFIRFEREAFGFAFLDSMIKYVRMNRGLNLQIRYNGLYNIFA